MQTVYLFRRDLRNADSLAHLEADSFDAVLCDAPYGLSAGRTQTWDDLEASERKGRGFQGHEWDAAVPGVSFWSRVLRVAKPGAPLLTFAGQRTYHRMTCAIEDAGFEVRDLMGWVFLTGFPHGLNVSAALDKRAGVEGEVVSVGSSGAAGASIGKTGLRGGEYVKRAPVTPEAKRWAGYDIALKPSIEPACLARKPVDRTIIDNALAHGCGPLNIDGCRLDGAAGWPTGLAFDDAATDDLNAQRAKASRLFCCPKVSTAEREAGCEALPARTGAAAVGRAEGSAGLNNPRAGAGRKAREVRNHHSTVKPIALTTYLARLLLPPPRLDGRPRRIMVPFSGSGSEAIGCLAAGWDEVVALENAADYLAIFRARVAHHCPGAILVTEAPAVTAESLAAAEAA